MALTQHVFISYAHEDGRPYRDQLIAKLRVVGFEDDDYWYDERDIEYGEEWRETIDKALAESFIVLVILTPKAVKSHSVTYEWARALGDGLKVIPLLFLKLRPKDEKHPLVNRKQWVDCTVNIPDGVIEKVKKYSETPPDTIYLNRLLSDIVMPIRILGRVSLWLYQYANSGVVDRGIFQKLIEQTHKEAGAATKKLAELMVERSHAFTAKQKRISRTLIWNLDSYYKTLEYRIPLPEEMLDSTAYWLDHPDSISRSEKHRIEKLEPIFEFLCAELGPTGYKAFDTHLRMLSEGKSSAIFPFFLDDYFSNEMLDLIWNAIEAVRISLFPEE